jgi:hypothetical protein
MKTFKMANETYRNKGKRERRRRAVFFWVRKEYKRLTNKENESRFFYLFLTYNLQNDVVLEAICVHPCKPKKIGRLFNFLLYKIHKFFFFLFF